MLTENPPDNPAAARSCFALATSLWNGVSGSAPGSPTGRKDCDTCQTPGVMFFEIAS